jgi:hypothetical protein
MNTLLIKLLIMPPVIAAVTLASKKWGNSIGGILASLPWVAGPILLFIAFEQGTGFAIKSISGIMVGIVGWLVFCIVYITVGQKFNALVSVLIGYLAYFSVGLALNPLLPSFNVYQWLMFSILALTIGFLFFPKVDDQEIKVGKTLKFEIPMRMLMITFFVITITFFAKSLGPDWSGILTPFPVMTAVLAIFTHYTQGIYQVRKIYMGLFTGTFGFTIFLFSQALLLPVYSVAISFLIGIVLDIIITLIMKAVFSKFNLL